MLAVNLYLSVLLPECCSQQGGAKERVHGDHVLLTYYIIYDILYIDIHVVMYVSSHNVPTKSFSLSV